MVNFTPDMQIALQAQYDNISENFGLSTRYRWEYRPGNELFVGLGQSALISNGGFIAQVTQATVRLGHTFRFLTRDSLRFTCVDIRGGRL